MKSNFLLFIILIFPTFLSAQWESLGDNIIPQNHRVWSIKVAPDTSVWAIATFDNFPPINQVPKAYRSIDEGDTWTNSSLPSALSTYGWDISPIDSNNAFIALDTAGLYHTSDGGDNWEKVDSFNYRPFYVHFFNSEEGWVLAADGTGFLVMSVTEDGGNNWLDISYTFGIPPGTSLPPLDSTESVLPFTFSINSAYDYDDESIILGTSKGGFWISNDRGKNWERKNSPLEGLGLLTSNIAMKDENTFMIAGDTDAGTFNGVSTVNFTTQDGGDTWIEGNSGVTAAASHYIPNSDSVFIMVGHNNFGWGSEGTAISYNYGASWEILDNTSLIAIDFIDENTGYGSCCNNFWQTANGQIHKWNFDLPTLTKDISVSSKIKLTPNPVADFLTIEVDEQFGENELSFEIISLDGRVVETWKSIVTKKMEINTQDLPQGFYVLKIEDKDEIISKKFIKQ